MAQTAATSKTRRRAAQSLVAVAALALASAGFWGTAWASADERPGHRSQVSLADLPGPRPDQSTFNPPKIVDRGDRTPLAPAGFTVSAFAEDLAHPRSLAVAPNGDVFLSEPDRGRVRVLRDGDGDGVAEERFDYARGFNRPHGIALAGGFVYIADQQAVWRFPYVPGDTKGQGREPLTPRGALGTPGGHWTRDIVLGPQGRFLYVSVGSRRNVAVEAPPRATIQRFALDGSGQITFASGLRNPIGLAFYPETDRLYTVVNERDRLGDGLVPDYLTQVDFGDFYGWPYAYLGANPDPDFGAVAPDKVAQSKVPDLLFESHSAPIGLVFYAGESFPPDYRGDAFVSLRGSWNAAKPTGYKVVRVPFEGGEPVGHYETFLSGFWIGGTDQAEVWGRPAGLALLADGSLLVADDTAKVVWRVRALP